MPWPHIGTRKDYEHYVQAFAHGTEGFEIACSVPYYAHIYRCGSEDCEEEFEHRTFNNDPPPELLCDHCGEVNYLAERDQEGSHDAGFTWESCDICDRNLGGDRQHFALTNPGSGKIRHVRACLDCVYFAEYGKLDDEAMLRVEQEG